MFFFLAIRNIIKNKKDCSFVALPIAVITLLFFLGNSVTGKTDRNIRKAYIESLTGDVLLQKSGDVSMNLFGANTPVIDSYFAIPVLPAYDTVMEIVRAEAGIQGITSQVSGNAYLDLLGVREPALLCGIDASTYFSLFPGIIIREGSFLQAGEYGAMITEERAQRIQQTSGQRPQIGMPLLFTSGGAIGFKIREVPLVGIYRYKNPGQFMNEIVIIDPQTVRILNSIHVAGTSETGESSIPLTEGSIDDLFSEDFAVDNDGSDSGGFSADFLRNFLTEQRADTNILERGGDWNFIILRLKKGSSANAVISSLNKKIEPYNLTAVNWRTASGSSAILMLLIQVLINSGIFLVSVAGVIAIINILLISVFRRVREIGTLRAIGASDFYIRSLFYSENLLIALVGGFAGVFCGAILMRAINSRNLRISNELIASVLGGPVLQLEFMPHIAVLSFFVAVLLGLAATVYPVEFAVRIKPDAAIRRGL